MVWFLLHPPAPTQQPLPFGVIPLLTHQTSSPPHDISTPGHAIKAHQNFKVQAWRGGDSTEVLIKTENINNETDALFVPRDAKCYMMLWDYSGIWLYQLGLYDPLGAFSSLIVELQNEQPGDAPTLSYNIFCFVPTRPLFAPSVNATTASLYLSSIWRWRTPQQTTVILPALTTPQLITNLPTAFQLQPTIRSPLREEGIVELLYRTPHDIVLSVGEGFGFTRGGVGIDPTLSLSTWFPEFSVVCRFAHTSTNINNKFTTHHTDFGVVLRANERVIVGNQPVLCTWDFLTPRALHQAHAAPHLTC